MDLDIHIDLGDVPRKITPSWYRVNTVNDPKLRICTSRASNSMKYGAGERLQRHGGRGRLGQQCVAAWERYLRDNGISVADLA
jgi:hypothetical protein